MRHAKSIRFSLALLSAASPAMAETGLYPEAAPPDSSFLRFVGFDAGEPLHFAGKRFKAPEKQSVPYVPVSAALLEGIAPGAFLTVVRDDAGQLQAINESTARDPAKVHLFLINATSQNLDLRVAGSETVVIESTAAMQSGTRAVNPVNIGLSVVAAGSKTPLQTFQVDLRRGQNISFLATSSGVQLIEHRFGPVAK